METSSQLLMEHLQSATRGGHEALNSVGFFQALFAHALPLESYVGELRAMAVIHCTLEQVISGLNQPPVAAVWSEGMRKYPLLQRDLAHFQHSVTADIPAAAEEAVKITGRIRQRSLEDPVSLLGYLYVFEGATMGAVELRPHFVATFQLTGCEGLEYLSSYGDDVQHNWRRFSQRMNQVEVDLSQRRRIVEAALEAFNGARCVFENLYPFSPESMRPLATSLNPEAGRHPIPSDPREIQASIRSGETCWRRFPYFEWRYGERGRRFTSSDSAWLVTLADHEQEAVHQEVRWLGQVLAARGMPRLMLEVHLTLLHEELVRVVPERAGEYEKLLRAAKRLEAVRLSRFDERTMRSIADGFEEAVGQSWNQKFPGVAMLLVASVADEKSGIKNAVESLESWFTEPGRFPDVWINAVRSTIQAARERAI